jgi:hypothetical protein
MRFDVLEVVRGDPAGLGLERIAFARDGNFSVAGGTLMDLP